MDANERGNVIQGLRSGPAIDQRADNFCLLMTSAPDELHEQEQRFAIEREGKFDLVIAAHHRKIKVVFSHVFVGDQYRLRGRYQFYLVPMEHENSGESPRSLLTFLIDPNGLFLLGGLEHIVIHNSAMPLAH